MDEDIYIAIFRVPKGWTPDEMHTACCCFNDEEGAFAGNESSTELIKAPKPMRYADKMVKEMYTRKDVGMYNQGLKDCGI